jgi:hypothetical protein
VKIIIFKVLYKKHVKVKIMKQISEMEDNPFTSSESLLYRGGGGHKEMSSILADLTDLVYEPRCGGERVAGSQTTSTANGAQITPYLTFSSIVILSTNNSIFNLFFDSYTVH